jgi:nicotinate-nucleotide adenylyltransferase
MCELAAVEEESIAACGLELERPGPSYTVDTLRAIHERSPNTRLTFILGADTARTLASWREPRRILELAGLAVAERDGAGRQPVLEALAPLTGPAPGERVRFLELPPIEVSSSQVRAAVAAGTPVESLVGPRVAAYIEREGLYRVDGPVVT